VFDSTAGVDFYSSLNDTDSRKLHCRRGWTCTNRSY